MPTLAERLKELSADLTPPFDAWVDSLSDADRKALEGAAASPMSTKRLLSAIRAFGGRVGEDRLKDWRRGHGWTGR